MKIKKTQLKQIVLEELKNVMNEMAVDEMAFSTADIEDATAGVDREDKIQLQAESDKKYSQLIARLVQAINTMGGAYVVEPNYRMNPDEAERTGVLEPYNKNVAILYRLLTGEAEKHLENWIGLPKLENNSKFLVSKNRDRNAVGILSEKAAIVVSIIDQIAQYAEQLDDLPMAGKEEPFLSYDNAHYLKQMAQRLRNEWVSSNFNKYRTVD